MIKEDKEFLKELQNELNTQPNDGTANPVIWGVLESHIQPVPDGYGEFAMILDNCTSYTVEEFIEVVEDCINDSEDEEEIKEFLEEWKNIDKKDAVDIVDFYNDLLGGQAEVFECIKRDEISHQATAFITKRACKEYIEKFGYNHNNPRTYAMCCYRNFELEKLLNIIRNLNIDDIKED